MNGQYVKAVISGKTRHGRVISSDDANLNVRWYNPFSWFFISAWISIGKLALRIKNFLVPEKVAVNPGYVERNRKNNKLSLQYLKSLYPPYQHSDNRPTKATQKGFQHKVNPVWMPEPPEISPAVIRHMGKK